MVYDGRKTKGTVGGRGTVLIVNLSACCMYGWYRITTEIGCASSTAARRLGKKDDDELLHKIVIVASPVPADA